MFTHVLFVELLEKRSDALIMRRLRRKLYALNSELAVESAEILVVCDVEEVDVLLVEVSGMSHRYMQGMR